MSQVVEADNEGAIHLSREMLGSARHARYRVEVMGGHVTLTPLVVYPPLWERLTPQERADEFRKWIAGLTRSENPVHLTNEQLRRENIYD